MTLFSCYFITNHYLRIIPSRSKSVCFQNICCCLAKLQLQDEAIRGHRIIISFSNFPVKSVFPHDVGVNTICCISDSFSSIHGVDSHPIRHPKTSYSAAQMAHYASVHCFSESRMQWYNGQAPGLRHCFCLTSKRTLI